MDNLLKAGQARLYELYNAGQNLHAIAEDELVRTSLFPGLLDRQARYRRLWGIVENLVKEGELKPRTEKQRRRAQTRGMKNVPSAGELPAEQATHDKTRDSWTIDLKNTPVKSEEEMFQKFAIDPEVWMVDRIIVNEWDMGYVQRESGKAKSIPLHQIKLYLKRRAVVDETKRIIASLKEDAGKHSPVYKPFIRIPQVAPGYMLEISIPDPHFGKYAWHEESGSDYDVDIAANLYQEALNDIVTKAAAGYDFDRICYVIGNDMLNADNLENTTTRGTPQTTDGRQHRTFRRVRSTVIASTERLMPLADVDVLVVPGNHDLMSAFYLGDSLESWFRKAPNVRVWNDPALRKYYEWGKNMLLFTHGSEEKHQLLAQIAAHEQPEMWGRTRYREAHIGHLHKAMLAQTLREETGFRVRMLSSISATDDWHFSKGFVGNWRSAEALVWSAEQGLVGQHLFTTPEHYEGAVQNGGRV
jgi:hypothetical protein